MSPRTGPFQKLSANDMVQPSISAKLAYLPKGSRYGDQAMTNKDRDRGLQLVEQLGIPTIDVHQAFSSVPDPLIYFPFRIPNVGGAGHYTEQDMRSSLTKSFGASSNVTCSTKSHDEQPLAHPELRIRRKALSTEHNNVQQPMGAKASTAAPFRA